jgi:hypothetical protein
MWVVRFGTLFLDLVATSSSSLTGFYCHRASGLRGQNFVPLPRYEAEKAELHPKVHSRLDALSKPM